jgi:hypothetical protein
MGGEDEDKYSFSARAEVLWITLMEPFLDRPQRTQAPI